MRKPLAGTGGAAVCACMLAAGVLVVTDAPSPPRPAAPAVALAALPRPFTASVPDLVDRVGTFAALVDPLVTGGGATRTSAPTAQPVSTAALAGGPISYAFTQIVNAVVKGVLTLVAPAMNNPTLAPIVGPAVLFGGILTGLVVGTVYSIIVGIENAVSGVVASIGAVLGGIFRLPAAPAVTAAGARPAATSPTAAAFSADVPAVVTPTVTGTDADGAPSQPRHKADPEPKRTTGPSQAPEPPATGRTTAADSPSADGAPPDTPTSATPVKPRPKVRPSLGSPQRPARGSTKFDGADTGPRLDGPDAGPRLDGPDAGPRLDGPDAGPRTTTVTTPDPAGDNGSAPDPAAA